MYIANTGPAGLRNAVLFVLILSGLAAGILACIM
jgi:hypothetical protein